MINRIKFTSCLLIIVAFVAIFGYLLDAWTGFPKGVDAYARITRIVYILDFFPNIFWQYHWANGMPTFQSEAPLFYFLGAVIAKIFALSAEQPLTILGFFTFVYIGTGIFGLVFTKTKSLASSLLATILAISSYSLWSWIIAGGIYPRIFAVGLSMIALWQVARFLQDAENKEDFPRIKFIWAAVAITLALITHALMGAFLLIAVFFFVFTSKISARKKFSYSFLLFLASFALAGFFFLPMIFNFGSGGAASFIGVISEVIPTPWYYLWDIAGVNPFLLPILAVTFIFALITIGRPKGESLIRLILAPLGMFLLFSTYALIGYTGLSGKYYYINGFIPLSATSFMTIYGSILVGFFASRIEKLLPRILPAIIIVLTLIISGISLYIFPNFIKNDIRFKNVYDSSSESKTNEIYQLRQILKFPEEDLNHRFAAYDAFEAVWFNADYRIPQVRDYYGQGILYPDWRYWFEQAVWNQEKFSLDEAKAALDWFAVRWFSYIEGDACLVDYGHLETTPVKICTQDEFLAKSTNRYLHEEGFKQAILSPYKDGGLEEVFEVDNPGPILSATNTPAALFIGDPKNYYVLFSNLTFSNYSSGKIVPVRGGKFIDDYSLSDLRPYKILILYSYNYHNSKNAASLINSYLSQGGNIFWETSDGPETLAKDGNQNMMKLLPGPNLIKTQIEGGNWNLQVGLDPLTEGLTPELFSPPVYNGTSWKISTFDNNSLRSDARILLAADDKPLLVSYKVGNGQVFWTGFNFLYHINSYKNLNEVQILYRIFDQLSVNGEIQPAFSSKFVNPQKREIQLSTPAQGILFKESYFKNWKAESINSKGKRQDLAIRLAGPGMMYAALNPEESYPIKVTFYYKLSLVEKTGFILSLVALIFLIVFALAPGLVGKVASQTKQKTPILKKTSSWWEDEEV